MSWIWPWPFKRLPGNERDVPWVPPETTDPTGLVGVGGDLSPDILIRAYAEGVFPWFSEGDPILWWSPDPRAIIPLDGLHISRSLARTIRSGKFRTSLNRNFVDVMRGCGNNREGGTWVTDEMIAGYSLLNKLGFAHSLEVWRGDELVGGIYGVAIGGLFAGESMFHHVTDASKVALAALFDHLNARGFVLFDTQMKTEHTTTMGAIEISRGEYLRRLKKAVFMEHVRFQEESLLPRDELPPS